MNRESKLGRKLPYNVKAEMALLGGALAAAHAYVDVLGWAVLPCYGKAPAQPEKAGGRGWLSATRHHEEIDRLWRI